MIALGEHWQFILWGYLGVAALTGALIGWTIRDARVQKARLDALEADRHRTGRS